MKRFWRLPHKYLGASVRSSEKTQLLIRYLTGTLPADESLRLEEQYLENEVLYEELLAVETDLLDSYARGELTGAEARVLKSHFPRHELRQRLLFSQALRRKSEASQARLAGNQSLPESRRLFRIPALVFARQRRWPVASAAAALVVATVTLLWLARRPEPAGPTVRSSPPQAIPAAPQSNPMPVPVATLVLIPRQRATREANTVRLPVAGGRLRLELIMSDGGVYDGYAVTLKAVGHPWSQTFRNVALQRKASGEPELVVDLSTAGLFPDDYTATVSGTRQGHEEEFAGYGFRLIQS
jgi:hypothetical protein